MLGAADFAQWDVSRLLPVSVTESSNRSVSRTTTTDWHPQFRLPVKVTEPGRETAYTYDSVGNPLSQTITDSASGISRTKRWTYHANGLVATETAPNGAVTSYQYDSYGNLTQATNALGQVDTYTHDGAGRVLTHTAPTGLVTTYTYDPRGRLLTTSAGGLTTTLTYRPSGQVATVTTPYGHTTSYSYDAAQRLTGWSDNRGHSGSYVLDPMGNRLSEEIRDAQGQTAWKLARTINSLNRVASTTVGSAGAPVTYGYDANGDLISATQTFNSAARTTQWQLDALRRVAATTSTEGATASVAYNALDDITQATDFKQVATSYTRDALGNAKAETSPDSGSQSATYDSLGLPQQVTDAMGRATTITRDALGRPTRLEYADGTATTLHYDLGGATYNASGAPQASVGYLSEVRDPSATTSYQRDLLGRIVRKTQTLAGGNLQSVGYSYASAGSAGAGQLQSITYPSGKTLQYSYDATGQINAVQWAGQPLLSNIGWTPLGQPTGWQWSGFANTAGRNNANQGTGDGTNATNATPLTERRTYTDAGQLASSALLQLGWDSAGRVSSIAQQHMLPGTQSAGNAGGTAQPQAVTLSSTYSYDNAGRLITSAHSAPATLALPSGWSLSDTIGANSMGYAYDTNGNRTQASYTLQTLAGTATEQRTEQTASGTNRLQSHSHTYTPAGSNASQTTTQDYPRDASGSLTRLGSQTLQYNAQGRIAAIATAGGSSNTAPTYSYQYNSSAQRLLKTDHRTGTAANTATPATEATLYADDATGSTVLGQYSNQRSTNSAAPAGETDSTEVLWLPTASGPMPIGAQINGRLYAIDSDHLNTPRRLTNAQGQVVWQWLITSYGEVAPTTGATGYAFEAPQLGGSSNTSGNVYSEEVNFKLRYPGQVWDEETGLSYNLNRYYDGQAGRYVQSDPIGLDGGWNRFAYVGGNPLLYFDSTGLAPSTTKSGELARTFYECMAEVGLDRPRFGPPVQFDDNLAGSGRANRFTRQITLDSTLYNDASLFNADGSMNNATAANFAHTLIHEGLHTREGVLGFIARGLMDLAARMDVGDGHDPLYNGYADNLMKWKGKELLDCMGRKMRNQQCK